ncbi:unnamed protein product, partial [Choristocarpus tenellus]
RGGTDHRGSGDGEGELCRDGSGAGVGGVVKGLDVGVNEGMGLESEEGISIERKSQTQRMLAAVDPRSAQTSKGTSRGDLQLFLLELSEAKANAGMPQAIAPQQQEERECLQGLGHEVGIRPPPEQTVHNDAAPEESSGAIKEAEGSLSDGRLTSVKPSQARPCTEQTGCNSTATKEGFGEIREVGGSLPGVCLTNVKPSQARANALGIKQSRGRDLAPRENVAEGRGVGKEDRGQPVSGLQSKTLAWRARGLNASSDWGIHSYPKPVPRPWGGMSGVGVGMGQGGR